MKNKTYAHLCTLLMSLIVFGMNAVSQMRTLAAQTTTTPSWEINQNLCPVGKGCGRIWHTSPDQEKLFLYTSLDRMLHVLSNDVNIPIQSYDMSTLFPLSQDQYFDFLPINDHVLVYFDREQDRLASVNLVTQEHQAYVVEHGMRSCTSSIEANPPFNAFYLLPDGHTLIVCRVDPVNGYTPHISKINVETNQLEDILVLEGTSYPYGYTRVIPGMDGAIYVEPGAGDFWGAIPGYNEPGDSGRDVARWDIETSSWSFLKITNPLLAPSTSIPRIPSFIGVDRDAHLYFWKVNYDNNVETATIITVNLDGDVIGQITNEELGSNPAIPEIQGDGTLRIINRPSFNSNTTIGIQINTIDIPDFMPITTPTATSTAGSSQNITVQISDGDNDVNEEGINGYVPDFNEIWVGTAGSTRGRG